MNRRRRPQDRPDERPDPDALCLSGRQGPRRPPPGRRAGGEPDRGAGRPLEPARPIRRPPQDDGGRGLHRFGQGSDGVVCVDAEHCLSRVYDGGHSWSKVLQPAGYEGDGAMAGLPNNGTLSMTDDAAKSPSLDYRIEFVKTGAHYRWVRACADTEAGNSVHVGLDGGPLEPPGAITFSPTRKWTWASKRMNGQNATFSVATAGIHTLQRWVREDGAVIDRLVITSDPKRCPNGNGPPESPHGGRRSGGATSSQAGRIPLDRSARGLPASESSRRRPRSLRRSTRGRAASSRGSSSRPRRTPAR